ncbi:hypothetical protein WJX74_000039 [Apatococcus lobatus]|uniref:BTB domain-containing protein n=1 Tax=Apatococcus lobatus TaxID=904363 RepID=A0AAW1Q6W0_9CHLO
MSTTRQAQVRRSPGKSSPSKTGSAANLWVPERGEFFLGNDLKQSLENGSLADISLTVLCGISSSTFGIHRFILAARLLPGSVREALLPFPQSQEASSQGSPDLLGQAGSAATVHQVSVCLKTGVGVPDFHNWLTAIYSGVWRCNGVIQGPASKQQLADIGLRLLHLPGAQPAEPAMAEAFPHQTSNAAATPSAMHEPGKENLAASLNILSLDGTLSSWFPEPRAWDTNYCQAYSAAWGYSSEKEQQQREANGEQPEECEWVRVRADAPGGSPVPGGRLRQGGRTSKTGAASPAARRETGAAPPAAMQEAGSAPDAASTASESGASTGGARLGPALRRPGNAGSRTLSRGEAPGLQSSAGRTGRNTSSGPRGRRPANVSQSSNQSAAAAAAAAAAGSDQREAPSISGASRQRGAMDLSDDIGGIFVAAQAGRGCSDVTLQLTGPDDSSALSLPAHRCILAARSDFFETMLTHQSWSEARAPILQLDTQECKTDLAGDLVQYLYTGRIAIPMQRATELLSLADRWQIRDFPKLMAFELRHGACQGFSRPQPRSTNLQEIPQVAAFAKSSVERGIAIEDFQELLQDCLRWLVANMVQAWPSKSLARQLPELHKDLLGQGKDCLRLHNALDMLARCNKLLGSIPAVAWAEPSKDLAADMQQAVHAWIGSQYPSLVLTGSFKGLLGSPMSAHMGEEVAQACCSSLKSGKDSTPLALAVLDVYHTPWVAVARQASSAETNPGAPKSNACRGDAPADRDAYGNNYQFPLLGWLLPEAADPSAAKAMLLTVVDAATVWLVQHRLQVLRSDTWQELPKPAQQRYRGLMNKHAGFTAGTQLPDIPQGKSLANGGGSAAFWVPADEPAPKQPPTLATQKLRGRARGLYNTESVPQS